SDLRAPLLHILVIDGEANEHDDGIAVQSLEAILCHAHEDVGWGEFDENQPSALCFTSGTTGQPKGVAYTHRSTYLHTLRLLQADVMSLTFQDVVMPVVPMFHASA